MPPTSVRDYLIAYRAREAQVMSIKVPQVWITILSAVILVLSLVATLAGILTGFGQHHHTFLSVRGEIVTMQGGGLYSYDSLSGASQAIGQDIVTLLVAIPMLIVATALVMRGSLRGMVVRAGILLYFAYTYLLMAFGGAYNPLFLVYVALYSASLFAFILSILSIGAARLRTGISTRFARRAVAWLMIGFGSLLTLMWLGRIVPSLASGTPPPGLDSYSTLFVQAGDLGLVIPLTVLAGVLLLRRTPLGYLLGGVMLVMGAMFGLALIAMAVAMAANGVTIVLPEVVFFSALAIVLGVSTIHYVSCLPRANGESSLQELAS